MDFTACSTSTCSSKRDKAEGSSLTKRLIQGTTFITDWRTLYLLAIVRIDSEESPRQIFIIRGNKIAQRTK